MSNWTHVAGVIRVDSIRCLEQLDIEKHFGKACKWKDSLDVWKDADQNPEKYLPMGSEGSLEMSIWTNPDTGCLAAYTVSIFGDLRDHDSPDEIIEWFKQKCKGLLIRQATITVENEVNGTKNWTYKEEE